MWASLVFVASLLLTGIKCIPAEHGNLELIWRDLDVLYQDYKISSISRRARELADQLSAKDAAWIVERAADKWDGSLSISSVAVELAATIAKDPDVFRKISLVLIDKFPQAYSPMLIEPFLKGRESLVDSPAWIQNYLSKMQGATISRCEPGESRDCGAFQANLAWIIKAFEETMQKKMSPWMVAWADRIQENALYGHKLKYAYIRLYLAASLMVNPQSNSLPDNKEASSALASLYLDIKMVDRLEVIEYFLWYYRIGDNLNAKYMLLSKVSMKQISSELRASLEWIIEFLVVTNSGDCNAVIKNLVSMDAFRTLSLIWQFNVCSPRASRDDFYSALEKNAPFSFAVYLTHGEGVRRHALAGRNIPKLYRLMLTMVPRMKHGVTQWDPCSYRKVPLMQYAWVPPLEIGDVSGHSVVFLARFLLYMQFGIPFDLSQVHHGILLRIFETDSLEELRWFELPRIANSLLRGYCYLNRRYPAYNIIVPRNFIGSSSRGDSSSGSFSTTSTDFGESSSDTSSFSSSELSTSSGSSTTSDSFMSKSSVEWIYEELRNNDQLKDLLADIMNRATESDKMALDVEKKGGPKIARENIPMREADPQTGNVLLKDTASDKDIKNPPPGVLMQSMEAQEREDKEESSPDARETIDGKGDEQIEKNAGYNEHYEHFDEREH